MRRSRSSTACCWAALENDPEGCTQAPSQAALGVSDSSPWAPDGGKARADTVRAPTRPVSRSRAVRTRDGTTGGLPGVTGGVTQSCSSLANTSPGAGVGAIRAAGPGGKARSLWGDAVLRRI